MACVFHRYTKLLVALLCALTLSACTGIPSYDQDERDIGRETFSFDEEMQDADVFAEYKISSGDILDVLFQVRPQVEENFTLQVDHTVAVKFPTLPELNEEQNVRPDGTISLPYLGSVRVIDKSLDALRRDLIERYRPILRDPELYIVVPEFRTQVKELKNDLHTAPRGLSRLVTVAPDGRVTFPMLGNLFVAGQTIPELNQDLNTRYAQVLPGLQVDLFLQKSAGALVYVLGAVDDPGAYEIRRPMTVLEALTLAGGFTDGASLGNIVVTRRSSEGKLVSRSVYVPDQLNAREGAKVFVIRPDDLIYVPKTGLKLAAETAEQLAKAIFFRGWGVSLGYDLEPLRGANNDLLLDAQ